MTINGHYTMTLRRLLRWLTPLALVVLCAAVARAAEQEPESASADRSPPVLAYFLAFVFAVGTLVILCMPSRKS